MALRNVLSQFRQSRIMGKKVEFQQRRTAFRYWKMTHQEEMDGAAKARQVFKQIPRQSLLAPKYRLRPFSERYHPTEVFDFLKQAGPWRIAVMGGIFAQAFYELFKERRDMEEILIDYYHPDTDTEIIWPTRKQENMLNRHWSWDQQQGIPYRD